MNVHAVTPILNVTSIPDSIAWFEKLGWQKHWVWGDDQPTFGAVISGHAEIFLCANCQGARGGPLPREPWDNQAGSVWMSWWLPSPTDVDAFYAHALELDVLAPFPPTDMPWSVRECHIRHPDGHTFRVGAGLPEE
jgi:hypothetical protein